MASLKIKGMPELLKKLTPEVYQAPIVRALEDATEVMAETAKTRARGSIRLTVKPDTRRVKAGTRLTTLPIGVVSTDSRHGIYLNSGAPGGKARWRDTGKGTKGWLRTVPKLAAVRRAVEAAMGRAATELEGVWRR